MGSWGPPRSPDPGRHTILVRAAGPECQPECQNVACRAGAPQKLQTSSFLPRADGRRVRPPEARAGPPRRGGGTGLEALGDED